MMLSAGFCGLPLQVGNLPRERRAAPLLEIAVP